MEADAGPADDDGARGPVRDDLEDHRLLIAGAIVYAGDPGFGRLLMGASLLPLIATLMGGRGRHLGR